jgi:hypothetical protein
MPSPHALRPLPARAPLEPEELRPRLLDHLGARAVDAILAWLERPAREERGPRS